jgi:RNA polymerase sigma factor (TIGR02999 family)
MGEDRSRATRLLSASMAGDKRAAEELIPLVYDDLRALAQKHLKRENPGHTLQATALVNEAYLRLIDAQPEGWNGKTHFFAVAAASLRRVLVDHARAKRTKKRGGDAQRVSVLDPAASATVPAIDLLALDEALKRLAATKPRHARLVELRFFGGLEVEEAAAILGVSKETAKVDWRFARAWLNRELAEQQET